MKLMSQKITWDCHSKRYKDQNERYTFIAHIDDET